MARTAGGLSAGDQLKRPEATHLFSNLPIATIVVDPNNQIISANDVAEAFFGTSQVRLIDRDISELLSFESKRLKSSLRDRSANFSAKSMKALVFNRGDMQIDCAVSEVMDFPGWRIITMARNDESEQFYDRRPVVSALSSIRAPEILSHEIKNPLAGIKGAAQLLGRKLADDQKPLSALIVSEVDRIAALIDQMQHLSTAKPANITSENVHVLIDRARQSIQAAIGINRYITVIYDPSLPNVLIDKDAMMQIMMNLLQNAVDATRELDDPHITVRTAFVFGGALTADGQGGPTKLPVEVAVSDNGPGVSDAVKEELFAPFVTDKKDGQGLGLALVKKLVRDMRGRISYDRDDRNGVTTFRVLLPVAERKKST